MRKIKSVRTDFEAGIIEHLGSVSAEMMEKLYQNFLKSDIYDAVDYLWKTSFKEMTK